MIRMAILATGKPSMVAPLGGHWGTHSLGPCYFFLAAFPAREGQMSLRRREFIAGLGGAAAWPLAAQAQQRGMPGVGFITAGSAETYADNVAAFRKGLSQSGYVEGQNVTVEYHWLNGQYDRMPAVV